MTDTQARLEELLTDGKTTPPPGKISYEEFLDWADEDTHAEWVDGEVIMTSPASFNHQNIAKFLLKTLDDYVVFKDLGEVIDAPFQMKITKAGREPDIIFVKKSRVNLIRPTFLDGPANVVVEIVSPESIERDTVTKLAEYENSGVPEYWLIDPIQQTATFRQLDSSGRYQEVAPDAKGRYYSREIAGFWLQVDWLWRQPLPEEQNVLLKIGGQDYKDYYLKRLEQEDDL